MSISQLVEMSNRYGRNEEVVLAGGGNTSFKEGGVMFVKGSGTSLAEITAEQFVKMDMGKLSAMLKKEYPAEDAAREAAALEDMMAARLPGEESKRPSVEAILHAIFPQKFVLHTHPAIINGLSCGKNGAEACRELFGGKAVWVPLTKPGYILAVVCGQLFDEHRKAAGKFPDMAILQNHGLFVAADTLEEIDALMDEIMGKMKARAGKAPDFSDVRFDADEACGIAPALRMLYAGEGDACAVFCANAQTLEFVGDEQAMRDLMAPFTPDHIVYCKHTPLFIAGGDDYREKFDGYIKEHGFPPKIVAVQGLGFFALGKTKKEADIARLLFLDAMKVAVYARAFGGVNPLPGDFVDFILNWEAENYRQKASLSGTGPKRLAGKIAIVTGGAQGFGKGIAEAMSAQGAYIVVADLNLDGANALAGELERAGGPGCAVAAKADVSDEDSVRAMVRTAVLSFGGLDILVSNAGILIAGSLDEITKEKFELVTSVNYTGYFLCAKHASVPMRLQHQYCPGRLFDIIEINSKSGLAGSNKNFAYAGSKFGGVGLTQSFALELIEHGIKVNAICPGNLLDGPLWSDPEKGLFKQYFDTGKVAGAKSVADVRKFYESKVPMGRGCTIDDVARAIFYVVEQQYETGQALPVTGGQVMLK